MNPHNPAIVPRARDSADVSRQSKPPGKALIAAGIFLVLLVVVLGWALFAPRVLVDRHKPQLDRKAMADVQQALWQAAKDEAGKRRIRAIGKKSGRAFWNECFKTGVLDPELKTKLICLNSAAGDTRADDVQFEEPYRGLLIQNCSYTSPMGEEFGAVIDMKGPRRTVVFTFNSRNWNSYPDLGVLCAWSDGSDPDWLTFEKAQAEYGITQEEWDDPAGRLFGRKDPFRYTLE